MFIFFLGRKPKKEGRLSTWGKKRNQGCFEILLHVEFCLGLLYNVSPSWGQGHLGILHRSFSEKSAGLCTCRCFLSFQPVPPISTWEIWESQGHVASFSIFIYQCSTLFLPKGIWGPESQPPSNCLVPFIRTPEAVAAASAGKKGKWSWKQMGVSINGGTPKWMVYKGKSFLKVDDLGVPPVQETSRSCSCGKQIISHLCVSLVEGSHVFGATLGAIGLGSEIDGLLASEWSETCRWSQRSGWNWGWPTFSESHSGKIRGNNGMIMGWTSMTMGFLWRFAMSTCFSDQPRGLEVYEPCNLLTSFKTSRVSHSRTDVVSQRYIEYVAR